MHLHGTHMQGKENTIILTRSVDDAAVLLLHWLLELVLRWTGRSWRKAVGRSGGFDAEVGSEDDRRDCCSLLVGNPSWVQERLRPCGSRCRVVSIR